jgi:hypothetical protein
MSTSVNVSKTTIYIIAVVVIIVAFVLLGGGTWLQGIGHRGGRTLDMSQINWVQVLIAMAIGFVLGLVVGKRRW